MNRFAIFVDAGYFLRAGADALTSNQTTRNQVRISSVSETVDALRNKSAELSGCNHFLRIYWYDAVHRSGLSTEQKNIAYAAGVKLRLGTLNQIGQQKGVDSLIVTDIIELARNKAISDAILISGDEDLRIAVQVAQSLGVRVHLLAVGNAKHNVSLDLRMEADAMHILDTSWLSQNLVMENETSIPSIPNNNEASPNLTLQAAASELTNELLDSLNPEKLQQLKNAINADSQIPNEYDRKLIAGTSRKMGGKRLSGDESRQIRGIFITKVRQLTQ